jgi:histidinol-phosphate aminotransferase
MAPYSPPTADREGKLRLDFNENTVGCSPRVIEFLRDRLSAGGLAVNPEYGEAKRALAGFFQVPQEQLLLTNGTDEAIRVFINTYVNAGDESCCFGRPTPCIAFTRRWRELKSGRSAIVCPHGFST